MRAAVVYESMFGNTRSVAEAIAEALSEHMDTELIEVGEASEVVDAEIGLLVVGAPTHAFSLSRPSTRAEAADQAPDGLVSAGIGMREWLQVVEAVPSTSAAAFDTRVRIRFAGSAAKASTRRLRRAGCRIIAPPESFAVKGTLGPLLPGEIDRARRWAATLAANCRAAGG